MNSPRDDEYAGLDELLGGDSDENPGEADGPVTPNPWGGLPPDLQVEYAEAFRRGYERARRGQELAAGPGAEQTLPEEPVRQEPAHEQFVPEEPAVREEPVVGGESEPTQLIHRPQPVEPTQLIHRPQPVEPTATERHSARPQPRGSGEHTAFPNHAEPTQRIEAGALAKLRESALAASQSASEAVRGWTQREGSGTPSGADRPRDRRLVVVGLGALALLVIAAAFGVGRMVAGAGSSDPQARVAGGHTRHGEPVYEGPVHAVAVADAMASCQTDDSADAAGNVVSYQPANAYDADLATAWRCDGSGRGQRFTITLPGDTVVGQVGLVPGYAKTDPVSGADRYAENNRITKVRWRFDDGTSFVQRMSGDPGNRRMRVMRIPETSTRRVVLQILASQPGPRNTVAISELRIASPRG